MPHEKIYHEKNRQGIARPELHIHWGMLPPFDDVVSLDVVRDGNLQGTITLDKQDCLDLIKYVKKAAKKTWAVSEQGHGQCLCSKVCQ